MKKYNDKTLVVFPDDQIKVIMIPQSLLDYIEDLEKKNKDDFIKHFNNYCSQPKNMTLSTYTPKYYLYPQNTSITQEDKNICPKQQSHSDI